MMASVNSMRQNSYSTAVARDVLADGRAACYKVRSSILLRHGSIVKCVEFGGFL